MGIRASRLSNCSLLPTKKTSTIFLTFLCGSLLSYAPSPSHGAQSESLSSNAVSATESMDDDASAVRPRQSFIEDVLASGRSPMRSSSRPRLDVTPILLKFADFLRRSGIPLKEDRNPSDSVIGVSANFNLNDQL